MIITANKEENNNQYCSPSSISGMKWILYRSAWYEPRAVTTTCWWALKQAGGKWALIPAAHYRDWQLIARWDREQPDEVARLVMPNPRPSVIIGILGELHRWDECQRTGQDFKNARGSESFLKVVQWSNFHRVKSASGGKHSRVTSAL